MAPNGNVNITISDTGTTVSLPSADVQVILACSSSGTANTVLATKQPTTLLSTYSHGPLTQAAGLAVGTGATVLAMRLPTVTAGAVAAKAAKVVNAATTASPVAITTTAPHLLVDGDVVTVAAVGGNTGANGTFPINVTGSTTFELIGSVGAGAYTSGGTVTPKGAIMLDEDGATVASGTAPVYFSGAAYDDAFIEVTVVTGFTVGTAGGEITISLDAGRTTNLPRIHVGTATTYLITELNTTINFGTGTLTAGYTIRGYTTAPAPDAAGIVTALTALAASPYGDSGWGSMHIACVLSAADAATVGAKISLLFSADDIDTRAISSARDASPPEAYGGTAETDSAWGTSVLTDFTAASQKRVAISAGYYNMRSAFSTVVCGTPLYRRSLAWAHACRVIELPSRADHEGWVRLGALSQITLNAVTDPVDGFVYHNEANGFVFDGVAGGAGRMGAARTRKKKPGWYMSNPLTLAPTGSNYALLPYCRVIDDAADLLRQVLTEDINARIKNNLNGTILDKVAKLLEADCYRALDTQIGDMYSGRTVVVDRDWNVKATGILKVDATINGDAFALQIDLNLGLAQA
jgi:hypothetical protein